MVCYLGPSLFAGFYLFGVLDYLMNGLGSLTGGFLGTSKREDKLIEMYSYKIVVLQ